MRIFLISSLLIVASSWAALPPQESITPDSLGFEVSEKGTDWELTPPPPEANTIKMLFRGKASNNSEPTLTVRLEKLQKDEHDLKDYMKRWLREYPKFGYNVLGSKPFNLDGRQAFVVDLVSTTSGKQARQVLTEKSRDVVLLTCLDEQARFKDSLQSCNTIIRSLKWK